MTLPDILLAAAYAGTAALLLVAAAASARGASLGRRWTGPERRREPWFREREDRRRTLAWRLLAAGVIVAGVLRTTGWLDLMTFAARGLARDRGIYAGRGPWQAMVTLGAVAACAGLAVAVGRARTAHRRQRTALATAGALAAVLAARTVSWHAAGSVLWTRLGGVSIGTYLESAALLGIAAAAAAAAWPGGGPGRRSGSGTDTRSTTG